MAKIAPYAFFQEFDDNGLPLNGGLLYTYEAGTTTPKATYTDADEGTANANPVILNASGRADVWLASGAYKLVLKTSAGVTVKEVDDVVGEASNVFGGSVVELSSNTSITTTYENNIIDCTAELTLTLLDVATAEEGFLFTLKNSGNGIVTVDPDGSELIDGASTLSIYSKQNALIVCTGTAWKSIFLGQYRKNNYTATAAPTVNDDTDLGYAEGSYWYDVTNDEAYVCLDATDGAAIWLNTTLTVADLGSAATKGFIDDDTFATASATTVPSSESTKAYVDAKTDLGGLVLLATATAASSASIDFTSLIDSTYDDYLFEFTNLIPATDDVGLRIRASVASSFLSGASDYGWRFLSSSSTSNDTGDSEIETTLTGATSGVSNVSSEGGVSGWFKLRNPASTTQQKAIDGITSLTQASGNGARNYGVFSGMVLTTNAVDGIQLFFSSGNVASGTVKMYGVKK